MTMQTSTQPPALYVALYKGQGRFIVNKLDILGTMFSKQIPNTAWPHRATSMLFTVTVLVASNKNTDLIKEIVCVNMSHQANLIIHNHHVNAHPIAIYWIWKIDWLCLLFRTYTAPTGRSQWRI